MPILALFGKSCANGARSAPEAAFLSCQCMAQHSSRQTLEEVVNPELAAWQAGGEACGGLESS